MLGQAPADTLREPADSRWIAALDGLCVIRSTTAPARRSAAAGYAVDGRAPAHGSQCAARALLDGLAMPVRNTCRTVGAVEATTFELTTLANLVQRRAMAHVVALSPPTEAQPRDGARSRIAKGKVRGYRGGVSDQPGTWISD